VRHDLHVSGLFLAKAQVVTAEAEFDRVAHRGSPNDFYGCSVTEAHFQKSPAQVGIATDGHDAAAAANAELVQAARFGGAAVVTTRK
jgi:hypothetical protein